MKPLRKVVTKAYPSEIGYTTAERTYACSAAPVYFVCYPAIPGYIQADDYWGYFPVSDCTLVPIVGNDADEKAT
jgi:hypothetical protein